MPFPLVSAADLRGPLSGEGVVVMFPAFVAVRMEEEGVPAGETDVRGLVAGVARELGQPKAEAAGMPGCILEPIRHPVVLICGHGARDGRCGVLGPILQREFEACLAREGVEASVGQITHIGGHKFAGNVIVYVPPGFRGARGDGEGKRRWTNVWYGRVRPEHCEGIVTKSILEGRVIEELYRGGMAGEAP